MGDGRFSLFTLELCPAKLNPLGLLLLSGPSSPLLPQQLSNGVGGICVSAVNTDTKPSHCHLLSTTVNGTVEVVWLLSQSINCNNFFAVPIPNVDVCKRFNVILLFLIVNIFNKIPGRFKYVLMKNSFFIRWCIFLVTTYWRKAIIADRGVSWVGPTSIDCVREEAEWGRRTICFKVQWLYTAVNVAATGTINIWTGTHVMRHGPPFRNIIILGCAVAPQPKLAFSCPPTHYLHSLCLRCDVLPLHLTRCSYTTLLDSEAWWEEISMNCNYSWYAWLEGSDMEENKS